ncbi:MAG: LysR family transcriptional regulator [Oscillospiraceae bacterium]|nr:LysR family transcriptional regulator [Oscillospiraceae bacterium]
MIEIYLLEQFDAVARCGTLSKAAEELHISQPALTRSMKKLEDALGVALFHRDKTRISLNETGRFAATLARSLLEQNAAMRERIVAFDRSLHSIVLGACAPYPILELMPLLQSHYGGMSITSELSNDAALCAGLKTERYQLAILHENTADSEIYCQRYLDEQLYIAVPETHRLAQRSTVSFRDLDGERFLVQAHVGFWMDVCRAHMPKTNFLIQSDADALAELVEGTDYPAFSSDRMIESGRAKALRVNIPIEDADAHATYYLACRSENRKKYASLFSAVRGMVLQGESFRPG